MLNADMIRDKLAQVSKSKMRRNSSPRSSGLRLRSDQPGISNYWIYGVHATLAALKNPRRKCIRVIATSKFLGTHDNTDGLERAEVKKRTEIEDLLPHGAVHQGLAALFRPLSNPTLVQALEETKAQKRASFVVLDQATDPRNIGAVLRSASGFGISCVVIQDRHAPLETGVMAKAASGAMETTPIVRITNLARGLAKMKEYGFWCIGLDNSAGTILAKAQLNGKIAFVYGAEGFGLRRLTRKTCDALVRIPLQGKMKTLNLANAVSISLYEWSR